MAKTTQKDKSFLNMAGEFAVASELNRRNVLASVTYGASKAADIFALSDDLRRVVRIEVKTTPDKRTKTRWVLGKKITEQPSSDVFWILIQLPPPGESPRFFVFAEQEIHDIWQKEKDECDRKFEARNHHKSDNIGVPGITFCDEILANENRWDKIASTFQKQTH